MLEILDDYDWREAFGYAGEQNTCATEWQSGPCVELALGSTVSMDYFCREDVVVVYYLEEGENDGPSWECIGRLQDGRFFHLEASCDYTGWDRQAGGSATVSHSLDHLLQFGIDNGTRMRFGLETI